MADRRLRLGIVGGQRGGSFNVALDQLKDRVRLAAICDLSPEVLERWKTQHPDILTYSSYEQFLREDTCDAVLLATPLQLHAEQSIAALRAGRHVLCEVTACRSHEDALALIDAVQKSGRTYMMAENYIYARPHLTVLNMIRAGLFGELTYAKGAYIHDCRSIMFEQSGPNEGQRTWRGSNSIRQRGVSYPTHSLGPVAAWLDLGRSDRMVSLVAMESSAHARADYAARRFGPDHEAAQPGAWTAGDTGICLIQTEKGRMIQILVDSASARPHHMKTHELQGTRACYITTADHKELIWLDGRSPGANPSNEPGAPRGSGAKMQWELLSKYYAEFDDKRWRDAEKVATAAGHGGGDYFEMVDFLDACEGGPNPVDVFAAVEWSSLVWLSAESIKTGRRIEAFNYRAACNGQPAAQL